MDRKYLMTVLNQNKDLNFIQRILEPNKWPTLDLGEGNYATHQMAWGDDGRGNYFVYPTVVYDQQSKQLRKLGDQDAWKHALDNKEYLRFKSADTADWISKNYKKAWDKPEYKINEE